MAQRLLLVALCAVIAVQLISSVEGARKSGCIARCNNGCRNKHAGKQKMLQCLMGCAIYPKNCLKCKKGDSKCYGCLPGYGLSMGTCIPCPLGCRCAEPNKCQSCLPGYSMASGVCKACPAVCESCDSTTGKCTCKSGYVATGSTTSPCAACSTNCGVCDRNGPGNCDTCKPGFLSTPANGICIACAANCKACDTAGAGGCDKCSDGYKLITSSSSSTVTCAACPANCQTCDYAGTSYCDTCMTGYGLSSDHKSCVVCAANCLTCNIQGYNKCDKIQCGTNALVTGYASKVCTSGSCSTAKGAGDGTCDVCYTSSTSCDICAAGNIQIKNTATGVTSCYAAGSCPLTTGTKADCLYCPGDGTKCAKCVDTKMGDDCTTTNGVCAAPAVYDPHCDFCDPNLTGPKNCIKCLKGYRLNADKTCSACAVKNCDVCETSATVCDVCTATYYPFNGGTVCNKDCDPRCATPDCANTLASKCDTYCVDGYALTTTAPFTCQACAPGCRSCRILGAGFCDDQQCATGYTLTADFKCAKA